MLAYNDIPVLVSDYTLIDKNVACSEKVGPAGPILLW